MQEEHLTAQRSLVTPQQAGPAGTRDEPTADVPAGSSWKPLLYKWNKTRLSPSATFIQHGVGSLATAIGQERKGIRTGEGEA